MNTSTDEDLIYLAGFLDGEGCFSIYRQKIIITCANCYKPIIDWLKQQFGGTVNKREARKETHRVCYSWRVVSGDAHSLLEQIVPYLREKQPQALLLLEYQKLTRYSKKDRKVTPYVIEERKRLEKLIKGMKHVSW